MSQQNIQPIWEYLDKRYKGIFTKQLEQSGWKPYWQISENTCQNISFYGMNLLQKKYSKTSVLYSMPVSIGYYRIKIWDQYKLRVPKGFNKRLRRELTNKNVDTIVCPFDMYGIYQENVFHLDLRHATVIIFNKLLKTVEFYDPMNNIEEENEDNENVHKLLTKYMSSIPELIDYTFVSLSTMNYDGFQYLEELSTEFDEYSSGGLCFIWSLFYAEIRMKYPRIPAHEVVGHYLETTNSDVLKMFIHDYAMYVYEEMLVQTPIDISNVRDSIRTYFENSMYN